ncbi:hypothetical protein STA3757_38330 [Stanieria sp. NIES-3757]|nr:hypothetical protein STA3757_38330 [Stanieria sp. NIES-3757]
MYHSLCLAIARCASAKPKPRFYLVNQFTNYSLNGLIGNMSAYSLTIVLTILIAAVSYRYLEKPLIGLKYKYSTSMSGSKK